MAYFNVQLITIYAVVKSNVQCKMCSCCIVNWPIVLFFAVVNPALNMLIVKKCPAIAALIM